MGVKFPITAGFNTLKRCFFNAENTQIYIP